MKTRSFLKFPILTLSFFIIAVLSFFGNVNAAVELPNLVSYYNGNWPNTDSKICLGGVSSFSSVAEAEIGGVGAVVITPQSSAAGLDVGTRHSAPEKLNIQLIDVRYIRYHYYYESSTPYNGRAMLYFPASEFCLSRDYTVYSNETVVSGKWSYLTFDVREVLRGQIFKGSLLPCFEFYPFADAEKGSLQGDRFGVLQINVLANDSLNAIAARSLGTLVDKYKVSFVSGRSDCTGEMQPLYIAENETFTLPECNFEREGYDFVGWICSFGAELYNPGDEYTLTLRGQTGTTDKVGRVDFIANWKKIEEVVEEATDYDVADYGVYWGGLVKPAAQTWQFAYATAYKQYNFDGINTLRIQFHPNHKDAGQRINFDGFSWLSLPLDIAKHKYLIVPYYFKTERETLDFDNPAFALLVGTSKALKESLMVFSREKLVPNQWSFMLFEFDVFKDYQKYINPEATTTRINQCHFRPFGDTAKAQCSRLLEGDELYLGNFIFLNEFPQEKPIFLNSFVEGYPDGTFRPGNNMTRAESAVLLARALGIAAGLDDGLSTSFSDILGEEYDWCRPYIAELERRGIIQNVSDSFYPDDFASETEFVKQVIRAKSGKASLTDFSDNALSDNERPLSRGRAVRTIFNLLRDYPIELDEEGINSIRTDYVDLDESNPFFSEIRYASTSLVAFTDNLGDIRFLNVLAENNAAAISGVTDKMIAEGELYLSELDRMTAERIEEIRRTESVYKQKEGGKTVYVSTTDGSPNNTGLSSDYPILISTLNDVNNINLSPGDVLLFKRGDTFRGNMSARAGVTYSAYGDGEKPVLTRSPENGSGAEKWTLVESDETGKKIWKYYNEGYLDVGAINLIDSSGEHTVAYKEVPSYRDGKFWVRGRMPNQNEYAPEGIEFNYVTHLDRDLEFFHKADSKIKNYSHDKLESGSSTIPDISTATGPIYLRCDKGNPGELYPRIEFNLRNNCIAVGAPNVTVDNLCILYFGSHGIGAGTVENLTVTNCEIGWGGGAIQNYQESWNYSSPGTVVRFGNGIEIYGGLYNYLIDNCYVYQIYDAGITHQVSAHSDGSYYMENVIYTRNVLEKCIYNIEYFMTSNNVAAADGTIPLRERYMNNVYFGENICRMAGYGWGVQRPDGNAPSNIRGWNTHNLSNNYVIENNVFDRTVDFKNQSNDFVVSVGTQYNSSTPFYRSNIFVQVPGRTLLGNGIVSKYPCNADAEELIASFGGVGNKVYFVHDDKAEYSEKVIY